jgi:hypothetical protein
MIGQYSRHIGPRFDRDTKSAPRIFRGSRRPVFFFYARPGFHRLSGRGPQPTVEQQALRSTAAEVARLFVTAARSAHGNAEKQAQLRAVLERSRTELSELVNGSSQQPQQANTENTPQVEQA